ncbi:MAG: type IV conjugative transfer system protein TraE [Gammaproteobacteria bacterium RIFCSPHIGHO2_12_FULL_40_19]|nr:MAG: type IV conjugative transfer system protein TraE [Gammaproteobacteria bacterium RIFCSPHIGHO2_12_FULL_40_19]
MEYHLFQRNLEDAHKIVKHLVLTCVSLLFAIILLIFLCISISHRNMTTLVPMNLNTPMTISNNSVSTQYLNESALSFINLRLNFDPDTIDLNHNIILRSIAPNNYQDIKKALDQESKLVKAQSISSSFYINDISINKKMLSVLFTGTLVRSVSDKALKSVKTQFQIDFENKNGLLLITQFFEVNNQ